MNLSFLNPNKNPWILVKGLNVIILVGLVAFVGYRSYSQPKQPTPERPSVAAALMAAALMAVQVVTPTYRVLHPRLETAGALVAQATASCGADIGPVRVKQVLVDVGDPVKAGQVLATLDSRQADLSLASARAALEQALAVFQSAKDTQDRNKQLAPSHAVSLQALAQSQAQLAQAAASLKAARVQVQSAELQVSRTKVFAPQSGVVTERTVQPGQVVSAGTSFFTLASNPKLQWQAQLTASQLTQVSIGGEALVGTGAEQVKGVISRLSPLRYGRHSDGVRVRRRDSPSAAARPAGFWFFGASPCAGAYRAGYSRGAHRRRILCVPG
jgi:RND family efflux transporter MFP subunit